MTASASSTRRSAISVQLLIQFGLDHGLSLERCLADTGLDFALVANPGAEIDAAQELALLRNLHNAFTDRPGIGLAIGLRYQLTTYGIWSFALLSSPTLRSAASLGLRYLDLTYTFHAMHLEEVGAEAHLLLDDSAVPADIRRFVLERDLGGLLASLDGLSNARIALRRACFRGPPPDDISLYVAELGVQPLFNQPDNRFVFDGSVLDQPLPGANPQLARHCEEQCQALLARRRVCSGIAGQIRDRLLSRPGQLPDMAQVADELHMSQRTLRRRLDEQGTSFRALLDEVRQSLAEELLRTSGIRLEEIAERLGYGEMSNFIHAFRRWKGITPRQFRLGEKADSLPS